MYLIIYNPQAGLRNDAELEKIESFFADHDLAYIIYQTEINRGPVDILRQALNDMTQEIQALIVGGGDGTVSQTIQAMHNESLNVPLLILSMGTTNEIAQNLFKKESLSDRLSHLKNPQTDFFDYGLFNRDKTFTYALTFGNFTEVTYETPQKLKNWLGYRAYILYGFLSFRRIKKYHIAVQADEVRFSGVYLFGAISNSKSMGNIIKFSEGDYNLQDGEFEVLLIKEPKSVKDLRIILQGLVNNDYKSEMFIQFKAKELIIRSGKSIDWNIDGEFAGSFKKVRVKNVTKKLELYTAKKQ